MRALGVDKPREIAFEVLDRVRTGEAYANLVLPRLLSKHNLSGRDAAFATEITYGTLRNVGLLDEVIKAASGRELSDIDRTVLYMPVNLLRTLFQIDCARLTILFLILVHILNAKFRTAANIDDVPFRKLFHVLRTPFHKDVALLVTPFLMLFQMLNKKFLTFVNIDLVTLNMLVNIFFVVLNIAPSVLLNIPLMTFHIPLIAPLNSPPNTLTTFNILPINHN